MNLISTTNGQGLPRRHSRRGWLRALMKPAILGLVTLAVCYPDPAALRRHVARIRNMDAMIDPAAPDLSELEREFRLRLSDDRGRRDREAARADSVAASQEESSSPADTFKAVERFILEKVQYEWDWNTWNVADYMPTVGEMAQRARDYSDGKMREDCDGRAVLAASLLRRMGYEAHLATDFGHVWVRAAGSDGVMRDLMGAGRVQGVESSARGNRVHWSRAFSNVPLAAAYGISVFPWRRELIVLVTLALLLSHPRMSPKSFATGMALLVAGWLLLRTPVDYWNGRAGHSWAGFAYAAAGCLVLWWAGRRARREEEAGRSGPQSGSAAATD